MTPDTDDFPSLAMPRRRRYEPSRKTVEQALKDGDIVRGIFICSGCDKKITTNYTDIETLEKAQAEETKLCHACRLTR